MEILARFSETNWVLQRLMPCLEMSGRYFMNVSFHRSVVLVALTAVLAGCVDPYGQPNYTGSGALIGGGSGALLGAAIDQIGRAHV